jgi:hypothetical protein
MPRQLQCQTVDTPDDSAANRQPTHPGRLRAKLPEILIEAASTQAGTPQGFRMTDFLTFARVDPASRGQ